MAKVVPFFRGRASVEKPIFLSLGSFLTELPLQGYHTGKGGSSRQSIWLGDKRGQGESTGPHRTVFTGL